MSNTRLKVVVIVGTGNIGCYTALLIARLQGIGMVVLIDKDRFEESNLAGQDITREDVGKPKVEAIGRRLRRVNPQLKVVTIVAAVEDLPLGFLCGDVLLGCLDSRRTRLYLAENAWALGVPYVDAGVQTDSLLARVSVFTPGRNAPCFQCGWGQADYDVVETEYPCQGGKPVTPAPTNGLASLGSLAASLQVIETYKLLGGKEGRVLSGQEILLNAKDHQHYVTGARRSPYCRFDHEVWRYHTIDLKPGRITLAKAFSLVIPETEGRSDLVTERLLQTHGIFLRVPGHRFARMMTCRQCARRERVLRLARRLRPSDHQCDCGCDDRDALTGDLSEGLTARDLLQSDLSLTLQDVGLEAGDVFSVTHRTRDQVVEQYFKIETEEYRKFRGRSQVTDKASGDGAGNGSGVPKNESGTRQRSKTRNKKQGEEREIRPQVEPR